MPGQGICKICLSPYRKELVSLFKQGYATTEIYMRYAKKMGYTSSKQAFYVLLKTHVAREHSTEAVLVPKEQGVSTASIESFGQKMLEMGMIKIQGMNPEDVPLKDVIQAQKLVLESKKVKIGEGAMMLMMRKMFAPPELNTEVIDGTTV